MHAQAVRAPCFSMSGESSLTLTPIPLSSPACSETNREASQHSSTKQCGHTAATTTPVCLIGTFGTVSPATADRTNHPQTYSKPSWNSIPHVWPMQTNPPLSLVRLLRHQGIRVGILSNAPYPIAKAIRRSEWGSLFDFFAFSCDYGICKPSRGIYRDVLHRLGTPVEDVAFIDDRREKCSRR